MNDRELLDMVWVVRAAGLHQAIIARLLNAEDVVLSPRDIAAIVRAAAAIGAKGEM